MAKRITRRNKQQMQSMQSNVDAEVIEIRPRYQRALAQPIKPLNDGQAALIDALKTTQVVCATGIAGSGKTYIAATLAADRLRARDIKKIVITRPNVGLGRSLGFFPGTADEKMSGWVAPLLEAISKRIGKAALEIALKHGDIVVQPLETLRGHSYDDASVLICDEAQNLTTAEVHCLTTRLGSNAQLVLCGDIEQRDTQASGLITVVEHIKRNPALGAVVELTECVRSDIAAEWIKTWRKA